MSTSSAHCFSPRPVAPEVVRLLSACPAAAVYLEISGTERSLQFGAANAAALGLLRVDIAEFPAAERGAALLACLHDEREPAFRERVLACATGGEAPPLKVLARRFGSMAPFPISGDAMSGLRTGQVLLETRFAPVPGGVLVFFQTAQAKSDLPAGIDPAATQHAIFEISRATHEALTLEALFERIHQIVERLIGVRNFYIALVDESEQMLRFVYSRDEFQVPRDRRIGPGVTELVYFSGQALLLDRAKANRMLEEGTVVNYGVPALVWLGVPLKVAGKAVGVMAVQDYHNPHLIGEPERQILTYISDQIANAVAVRRAEDAARQARADAERAGRVKADFLAVMSHELRTPLTAVIGFSDLLQEKLGATTEGRQAASIGQAGHRLLAAIDQMLDFSRVDALAQPLHEENVNLEQLLLICHGFFSARMREKNLSFAIRHEGFVPVCVQTDGQILKQILIHLLGNAVKFTSTGGRIVLFVRAEPVAPLQANRHWLEFTIEDNGVGIEPAAMARLFEPFEQSQRPGVNQGTGLGLAVSQRLAALLGGKIVARSRPGEGSAFSLRFTAAAATRTGQQPPEPDVAAQRELLLRYRIAGLDWSALIVDGNAEHRAMLAALIESVTGRTAETAADLSEAGQLIPAAARVVLVDVADLETDAAGFCRTLRERATGAEPARLHIIALSVDHAPQLIQHCLASGADAYLPKPVSRRSLIEALLATLEKR